MLQAYGCSMETKKTRWKELPAEKRSAITVAGVVQLVLLVLAQRDISKKPAAQIRGPKGLWRLATLINFIGPIAYFAFGRRRK